VEIRKWKLEIENSVGCRADEVKEVNEIKEVED
jgi:hypothetical protein